MRWDLVAGKENRREGATPSSLGQACLLFVFRVSFVGRKCCAQWLLRAALLLPLPRPAQLRKDPYVENLGCEPKGDSRPRLFLDQVLLP